MCTNKHRFNILFYYISDNNNIVNFYVYYTKLVNLI